MSNSLWALWTVAFQAPLSMGFFRQEYWSGLPIPSLGNLPNPGIEPGSPALQADTLPSEPPGKLNVKTLLSAGLIWYQMLPCPRKLKSTSHVLLTHFWSDIALLPFSKKAWIWGKGATFTFTASITTVLVIGEIDGVMTFDEWPKATLPKWPSSLV